MNVEITQEAFDVLIGDDYTVKRTEEMELAIKWFYVRHGVLLIVVHNYIGAITQYFIQDINA